MFVKIKFMENGYEPGGAKVRKTHEGIINSQAIACIDATDNTVTLTNGGIINVDKESMNSIIDSTGFSIDDFK